VGEWTPERGYGGPDVTPRDTVESLTERLREAQTTAIVLALRVVALEARVDDERRLLRKAMELLGGAPSVARGWRDPGPAGPTDEELSAHHERHAAGRPQARISWWMASDGGALRLVRVTEVRGRPYLSMPHRPGIVERWRPLTAEGEPATWPEVTHG